MEWTRRLSDETERNTGSLRVGLRWRKRDPEAFGEWLKESDLPEETRQIILAAPQPPRRPARMRAQPEPAQPESASGL
jgi:hypothetical protein